MASVPFGVEPVEVRVERLLPSGLLVRLESGASGLIREREIAWDQEGRRNWEERFAVGDRLQAVPLSSGSEERLELSLRLAEDDPWARLDPRRDLGRMLEGEVTGVHHYGIFIEIAPGVTGLLRSSRLPLWAHGSALEELFWIGDRVMVTIERLDLNQRHIGLSLSRALEQRWAGLAAPGEPTHVPAPPVPVHEPAERPGGLLAEGGHVLVIEDDPAQLAALESWLGVAGYTVCGAASGELGLELLAREPIDLVLSDYGLPGLDGVSVLREIRRRRPHVRCVLMTDWSQSSGRLAAPERLSRFGIRLLRKPLSAEDLAGLLAEPAELSLALEETAAGAALLGGIAGEPSGEGSLRRRLPQLLTQLQSDAGVAKVALFRLDLAQRKVQLVAEAGGAPMAADVMADLLYSPVRDVAEDAMVFHVHDALLAESRVRYLRPLLDFRSCLGLPVPVEAPERYALFLFSPRLGAMSQIQEQQARAVALAIGATIERQMILSHGQEIQRLALLGQLGRALVHEINHHIGTVTVTQSTLATHLARLETTPAPGPAFDRQLASVRASHQLLARGLENLFTTAQLFGQVAAPQHDQTIDVAGALREVAALVRDTADRARIRLHLELAPDLPTQQFQAVPLQQMLLNVLINALQQISMLHRPAGGRVVVRARRGENGEGVEVQVEDDGPGVHRRLWERVFELGFTTRREGGSGLGLYITRSLADTLGATVCIAESRALWGTTFAINLPAQGA